MGDMSMHVRLLAGVAGAAALVLLAPPSTGYAGTEHAATRTAPVWQACPPPADPTTQREPRQLCATLRVPMDHRQPNGRQITIEISRIASA